VENIHVTGKAKNNKADSYEVLPYAAEEVLQREGIKLIQDKR
jgi:hypothetical protein